MPKRGYKQTPEHIAKSAKARLGTKKKNARGWIHNGYRFFMHNGHEMQEHRIVMENYLDRPLDPHEIVHHINGDCLDNRIENLELMTLSRHTIHHNTGKSRKGQKRPPLTPEAKLKISLAKKGKPLSAEHRAAIGIGVRRIRKLIFWSSRKRTHADTISTSGSENTNPASCLKK